MTTMASYNISSAFWRKHYYVFKPAIVWTNEYDQ